MTADELLGGHKDDPEAHGDGAGGDSDLPQIIVTARPLREVASDALAALVAANSPPEVFVRRGRLTRVRMDEQGRPGIDALTDAMLRHRLARVADFLRVLKEGSGRHTSPPADVVADILAFPGWRGIPALEAVTEVPVLRVDGSVVDEPGYDAETRLVYWPPAGTLIPRVPAIPTSKDIVSARETILDVIGEFPFTSLASLANTIGLLLTPVVRPAVQGTVPMALIDKPKRGTGASLIAQAVQLVATGKMTELMTAPREDEEWRKKITAALIAGSTIMFFDNVEHALSSPSLAAALTAPEWSDRLLGYSEIVRAPNRATWIATGNNLKVGGDLARRCYWIRLDAGVARPWRLDGFRHPNLLAYVFAHRGAILGALLTFARHWFAEGRPTAAVPRLGGFDEWAGTVGGILNLAGINDFLVNLNELYDQVDEDETAWAAFLTAWAVQYRDDSVTVATLAEEMRSDMSTLRPALPEDLAEALTLDAKGKASFVRRLGKALAKRAGAVFGTWKLERAGTNSDTNVVRWVVHQATPPRRVSGFRTGQYGSRITECGRRSGRNKPGKPGKPGERLRGVGRGCCMTPAALLADLRRRSVRLEPDPSGLRYRARRGVLTAADKETLRRHRDELIALLVEEVALEVFAGASVVYCGATRPSWDGAPLVPARELFPIGTPTTITPTTTGATAVQGEFLDMRDRTR